MGFRRQYYSILGLVPGDIVGEIREVKNVQHSQFQPNKNLSLVVFMIISISLNRTLIKFLLKNFVGLWNCLSHCIIVDLRFLKKCKKEFT